MAMPLGLIGTKCGMTGFYTQDGQWVPVTVVRVLPNRISQRKTQENDGYCALQITTGETKPSRINKSDANHFAKANITAGRGLWEFRLHDENEGNDLKVGDELTVALFQVGQKVDVRGTSKGRGFAGVIRRHNFRSQKQSHGNSISHRKPGSIGQCQTPGRVIKGKRMSGHMGNEQACSQNLEIIKVDTDRSCLLIKGAVPGGRGGDLVILPAIKARVQEGS